MTGEPPLRWRAARTTLVVAITAATVAIGVLVALAALAWFREGSWVVALLIGLLAVAGLGYVWRYALHPQVFLTDDDVVVRNPWHTHTLALDDLAVVAPGENGMRLGTAEESVEAWCIQKPLSAIRAGRTDTRADRIATELTAALDTRDRTHPAALPRHLPDEDGFLVRRASYVDAPLLADLERQTGEAALGHIFGDRPYPLDDVTERWQQKILDPAIQVRVGVLDGEPIGYLAFSADQIHHVGIRPDRFRKGYGSRLVDYATGEIFDQLVPRARLWVLTDNRTACSFYLARGWRPSGGSQPSEFPPHPEEVEMIMDNPVTPRHGGR